MAHAGNDQADAFLPTTIDPPHGKLTAPETDIEHRPGSLGLAAHPLEHMTVQQPVAGGQEAIGSLKLLQRISEQLL